MTASSEKLLIDQDFERLFIDTLGWDRFSNRLTVSMAAPGQFTQGWLTREERWMKATVRQINYHLKGVARLGGQVVFAIEFADERSMPDYLRRCSIGRRISRIHYEPILIYSCPNDRDQVWQLVASSGGEPSFFEHRLDSHSDVVDFVPRLESLRFPLEERIAGVSSIEVSERVRRALSYRRQKRVFDRSRHTALTFEQFGNGLPELADLADEHRGIDRHEESTLFEQAREGSSSAKWHLFRSHLYIPLKIALRTYQQKQLEGRVELADIVSHGMIGLLNAIRLFKSDQAPRFMTYASLWVQREIDREVFALLREIAIPFYVEGNFAPHIRKFPIEADKLSQRLRREPYPLEIQEWMNLDDLDWRTLNLMMETPARIDIEDDDIEAVAEANDLVEEPFLVDESYGSEIDTLEMLMQKLQPRHKDALLLRFGIHPEHYGWECTLDEVASRMNVSRERARQMELTAKKNLTAMVAELQRQSQNRLDTRTHA